MALMTAPATARGSVNANADNPYPALGLAMLTALCDIERNQPTDDGQGSEAENWQPYLIDVPCRLIEPKGYEEQIHGEAQAALTQWTLQVPRNTDLKNADRVVVGEQMFEVTDTDQGLTAALVLSARLVRITV